MTTARPTYPTRLLTDLQRPAPYTPAVKTDIRRTLRRARLLQHLQSLSQARPSQPEIPNLAPPMALPVEVLMHIPARRARGAA